MAPERAQELKCTKLVPKAPRRGTELDTNTSVQVHARNRLLFSRREAARAGIKLPASDSRSEHIRKHLAAQKGDIVRIGVVNGLKACPTPLVHCLAPQIAKHWHFSARRWTECRGRRW